VYGLFVEVTSGYEFAKVTSGLGISGLEFTLANKHRKNGGVSAKIKKGIWSFSQNNNI